MSDVLFSISHKRTVGGDRRLQSPRAVPPVSRPGTFLHLPVRAADSGPAPRANGVSEGRLAGLGCRAALRLGSLNDLVPRSRLGASPRVQARATESLHPTKCHLSPPVLCPARRQSHWTSSAAAGHTESTSGRMFSRCHAKKAWLFPGPGHPSGKRAALSDFTSVSAGGPAEGLALTNAADAHG